MIDFERKNMARVAVIKEVIDHPNADRLDIVTIDEWQCVSQKGTFTKGDLCVYLEIDSILPMEVESAIFGPDAKVKLKNSRVKTIRLRGAISQGMAVPLHVLGVPSGKKGQDLTKKLKIGKHVPTPKSTSILHTKTKTRIKFENPNFEKMRKPSHFKNVGAFKEPVMITEKIHGTSFLAGWFKRPTRNIIERLNVKFFGEYQFCWRSMNNQLQGKDTLVNNIMIKLGFRKAVDIDESLYGRMCTKYDLKNVLSMGHAVAGEIYGDGIQKGYKYGCKKDEQKVAAFGYRVEGVELAPETAHLSFGLCGIPAVPILYSGPFPQNIEKYTVGPSVLDPKNKVREGCVAVTLSGKKGWHGTCLVKNLNPAYLLKDNTEFN